MMPVGEEGNEALVNLRGPAAGQRGHTRWPRPAWPLLAVLAVQAALSLRLVWSNTAFQDEALYLWAGHLELAHWLHGTAIPAFPAFLSGSPVVYPPLGAMADSIAGLAAARILSLAFMLAATGLLWATVTRLYGRRPAFFSCAAFATLGVTLRLGAFATYDPMSLSLLALAAWCAVRAGERQKSSGWLVATAAMLALANATKYASALFDPVVAGLVVCTSCRLVTAKQSLGRAATMLCYTAGIMVFIFSLGGSEYLTAVTQSTLARVNSADSVSAVVAQSWRLTGVVVILAFTGAALSLAAERGWPDRLLIWLAAGAALLVPLSQARIHTTTSLDKHLAFGAWFAAIAAGYAVDRLISWAQPHRASRAWWRPATWIAPAACVLLLAVPARIGIIQAPALFRTWPNSAALISTLSRLVPRTAGPVLTEHPSLPEYYLAQGAQWDRWSSTHSIRLLNGHSIDPRNGSSLAPQVYTNLIRTGFFSLVILDFGPSASLDAALTQALQRNYHYHLVAAVPYGRRGAMVWEYRPQHHYPPVSPGGEAVPPAEGLLTPVARPSAILGPIVIAVTSTGLLTLLIAVWIRYGWRQRKASDET